MVYDRAFFDFDIDNEEAHQIKKQLQNLGNHSLNDREKLQTELKEKLRNLIINERIAEPAINEAKDFAKRFKESFGREAILFFSGCKGAHAYLFFKPTDLVDINRALSYFADKIKTAYNYKTLDLSVNKDAKSRLSRVPYSKHQYTDLTVILFQVDDSYDEIMDKSLSPGIDPFTREDHLTDFNLHLSEIDRIEEYNDKVRKEVKKFTILRSGSRGKVKDHRLFFKSILGEPERKYPDKEYVMYKCPFPGHSDNKPSFRVHKTGYCCYGCGKKGNYFQFIKDYNNWSNEQVKAHLKSKISKNSFGGINV
jgi:hypothetical protein